MLKNMKKKASNNGNNGDAEVPKQKERHIVSWSQEEDDILREQIRIHGTENWTIIAAKFKDKTTRQCRRRWYTYLNSDFKKGGWSPEEDMLLCEAQKIFGNRWTEIAKVVSGRTDNAVKNRFSTLCKKRAKHEALAKENNASFINLNNKRIIFPSGLNIDGVSDTTAPNKKMRIHMSNLSEDPNNGEKSIGEYERLNELLRSPFVVLAQNLRNGAGNVLIQQQVDNKNETSTDAADNNRTQGTFLKKDDPKILALMQQAELLSNLALKVNSENTVQSLENVWQVLQNYLSQSKESGAPKFADLYSSFQIENMKDLVEDLRSSNEGSGPSLRQSDLQVSSPDSSEYSSGSTMLSHVEGDKVEQGQSGQCELTNQNIEAELQSALLGGPNGTGEAEIGISCDTAKACIFPLSETTTQATEGVACQNSDMQFSSPIQVTPLFQSLAAAVPTPNFSESERHFLLKTLGLESTSPNPSANPAQPPPCKRVLLHSL